MTISDSSVGNVVPLGYSEIDSDPWHGWQFTGVDSTLDFIFD